MTLSLSKKYPLSRIVSKDPKSGYHMKAIFIGDYRLRVTYKRFSFIGVVKNVAQPAT